jgi:flavin reductase (DIM6/NTAB) family NADH-FMN oxidoreductase RutF
MAIYLNIEPKESYKLLNTGALTIVSTLDSKGNFNLTPIAWHTPVDYEPVTKLLFVTDINHKAYANIKETGEFVICIPHSSQVQMVRNIGSCSGFSVNKIQAFEIEYSLSEKYQMAVPNGCLAYIECKKKKEIEEEGVAIVIGEVINARAIKEAYRNRLLSEKKIAKTLHHLGNDKFIEPGDLIE